VSPPLQPTVTPDDVSDEEDDGLDPLFSGAAGVAQWDPLGAPAEGDGEGDDDDDGLGGGGLIEELRREQRSAKKRLDMDEADGEVASGAGARAEAKGKRSKRKRKEEAPTMESAREKKRSEKVTGRSLLRSGSGRWLVQLLAGFADVWCCGFMCVGKEGAA
jgi:hypothetical protein